VATILMIFLTINCPNYPLISRLGGLGSVITLSPMVRNKYIPCSINVTQRPPSNHLR